MRAATISQLTECQWFIPVHGEAEYKGRIMHAVSKEMGAVAFAGCDAAALVGARHSACAVVVFESKSSLTRGFAPESLLGEINARKPHARSVLGSCTSVPMLPIPIPMLPTPMSPIPIPIPMLPLPICPPPPPTPSPCPLSLSPSSPLGCARELRSKVTCESLGSTTLTMPALALRGTW